MILLPPCLVVGPQGASLVRAGNRSGINQVRVVWVPHSLEYER